uniref:UDP-glucuronosyltransferase n=1 Tax=Timema cristinae TaxID=61476 RepID=A0A7R9GVE5_TIMCR|nr:unnamed protein product [Timema cristinae]
MVFPWFTALLVCLTWNAQSSTQSRILGIFGHIGKSHFFVFEPLLKALAAKGHNITVISYFPQKKILPNYTDIDLHGSVTTLEPTGGVTFEDITGGSNFGTARMVVDLGAQDCERVYSHPSIMKLIHSEEKFDLVINELFNTDCYLGIADRLKSPHIALSSHALVPWANDRFGNPDNPAYIPNLFLLLSNRMDFFERFQNTLTLLYHKIIYYYISDPKVIPIFKKYLVNSSPLEELKRNTSLILVNTHFSLNQPRPLVPTVIEVGGIHFQQPKNLPVDLDKFISEAKHGVVYFSMGSMIRAETFPEEKRRAFLEAFSELPQRVLWKWEGDELPDKPDNVLTQKWMPQFDILCHPNIRAYIGHGGLLGTLEAASRGVPMIGIPMFGDQFNNMKSMAETGMGLVLQYKDITKNNVREALRAVLENPSYQENAKRVSRAFNDRPLSPLDTAVYWTEYVIRHRGAPHMRTAAVDMPWYQYLLLDVIAVLSIGACAILYISYLTLATVYNLILRTTSKTKTQ